MTRSLLALVAGLVVFAVLTRVGLSVASGDGGTGTAEPSAGCLAFHLALGAAAGVVAGYTAAAIGNHAPLPHALGVAVMLAALSFYALPRPTESGQPRWLPYALTALGSAGVLAGGVLRSRRDVVSAAPDAP
jgi:hypothetical protein